MPDDIAIRDASNAVTTVATDEVGARHYQIVKLATGPDGTITLLPATVAGSDTLPDPTALSVLAHRYAYAPAGGVAQWARLRTPNVFRTVTLASGTAETAIWTPASGRRYRLMGLVLTPGAATTLTFRDGTGGTVVFVARAGADQVIRVDLGNGLLSGAADRVLTVTRSATATLDGTVWGTEE